MAVLRRASINHTSRSRPIWLHNQLRFCLLPCLASVHARQHHIEIADLRCALFVWRFVNMRNWHYRNVHLNLTSSIPEYGWLWNIVFQKLRRRVCPPSANLSFSRIYKHIASKRPKSTCSKCPIRCKYNSLCMAKSNVLAQVKSMVCCKCFHSLCVAAYMLTCTRNYNFSLARVARASDNNRNELFFTPLKLNERIHNFL